MRFLRFAGLATSLCLGAFAAHAESYACQMTTMGQSGGWVPEQFQVTLSGQEAMIFTPRGDIAGRIARYNASGFSVVASQQISNAGQHGTLNYRLTYNSRTNVARVRVTPLGYANNFSARGSCVRQS
ncbi:hypothetical protein [Jannaschia sp. CCS1]|uniref:hypothetical protein n=1 Tax=Jannaschia sp. (strain CCS1) TaxID=290400 RepID=UPI000053D563|nr:hypothetical protein [Jannaschia sp. CCS1]ABD55105.1 hypothetical protein Jann_2188 [Jannaschia sp. CCS1]